MINLNHGAHHTDGNACLSIGDDEHVIFGKQPLSNPTSEASAVSDEGTRGDPIVSASARTCSCPGSLDLHIDWFSTKAPSSDLVPSDQHCRRLPGL